MLKVIKFRKVKNQFLTKLKSDIKTAKQSKKTLTFADKTSKMYRLRKEEHEELVTNAVTSNDKKVNNSIKKKTNMAGKQILKNNEILLDVILDKINLAIREYFSFNQWKNTQNIID